jgi:hypothetical protein
MSLIRLSRALAAACLLASAVAGADGQRVQFLGHHSEVPASWVPEEVTSSMRLLQFAIPGEGEAGSGQFVLYYFGPGQGGSVEANVERWRSQFSRPDGAEVEAVVTPLEGSAMPATLVELEGSYARSVGMGQVGEVLPDRMLLAGVVETPQGNLHPQLHGPAELVKGQREAFIAFLRGITVDPKAKGTAH